MIAATVGTWLNYATTIAFQVLFASRLGSSSEASAFLVVFGIAVAVAGVGVSTAQSVLTPRFIGPRGGLASDTASLALRLHLTFIAISLAIALCGASVADALGDVTRLPPNALASAVGPAAVFVATQVAAGILGALGIARGARLLVATSPVFPSLAGVAWLIAFRRTDASGLMAAVALGSAAQVLALSLGLRRLPLESTSHPHMATQVLVTFGHYALLSSFLPLERVLASLSGPDGTARYFYAVASLAAVQQLLVGGLVLGGLSQWTQMARMGERERLAESLDKALATAVLMLGVAIACAIAGSRALVSLVYLHGAFTPSDVRAVAALLLAALPALFAEGVGVVLTQALLATRRNATAVRIGLFAFALRLALAVPLAIVGGALGLAVAYSLSRLAVLVVQLKVARQHDLLAPRESRVVGSMVVVAIAVASAVLLEQSGVDGQLGVVVVLLAGLVGWLLVRPDTFLFNHRARIRSRQ